ncbi:MAG: RNA polymerase sigma-54 factor, partial [Desulfobacteraceae bacterium]|nr:RNA polymerase sigma-54 factor [Desulfobacteraceae bacterium]
MTPQLQQAIKLLQLSRLELVETIQQEMEENPVLEEQALGETDEEGDKGEYAKEPSEEKVPEIREVTVEESARDDIDWENYLSEYNTGWAELPYEESESAPIESVTSSKTNLYSHLTWQLNMSGLDEKQREIGANIIGNLNEDGYLDITLEEISEITGHPLKEVDEVLLVIQNFDPVG